MTFTVVRIIFIILGITGITFSVPLTAAYFLGEYSVIPSFLIPMAVSILLGIFFMYSGKSKKSYLSTRAGFIVVAFSWIAVSLFGALPLFLSGSIPSFTDAFFESASGFSTTGATIIDDVESLPRSINLWRCQTHWLGGMGIVALTVALLPILGVGGFQLIKAETTGPEKGKLTSKITDTAKVLWFIYFGMTMIEFVLLKFAGMDLIDALSHAFSTLGTGGFSTKNSSIGYYNSLSIEVICSVFMFLSGINFSLYYFGFTGKLSDVKDNTEFKVYVSLCLSAILLVTFVQIKNYGGFLTSLRYSSFQTLSIVSTTGFSTADFTLWAPAAQTVLFILFFTGGSSGSTSGGVKVIRWVVLFKQLKNEILKMLHPHGIFTIRINKRAGRKDVVFSVAAFFMCFAMIVAFTTFFGALFGLDVFSSFTGALSMAGNIGPGFNQLGPSHTFSFLPAAVKWWYSFVMMAGRLEFFTMMIFFAPAFWKR
ncbi:TrkH family potassium uptake protein [Treponema rectale]|uniref:Trk system potassium uptake protein TrkH n=1 Tax=Treponema rectale TaxID=744512 RepID=A0A840SAT3_9SPIR|nr:potassium transporter TrkG [Treponema rectale]MBB5217810.1 trk system potassium uptake protein TrkH [Treponema rectale]QOS40463.1 TrkH family potassium uptake protein [Treponema rectale]